MNLTQRDPRHPGASTGPSVDGAAMHEARPLRERLAVGCDAGVAGALMIAVVWAPLAGGAQSPTSVAALEELVFALMLIWTLKVALLRPRSMPASAGLVALAMPMAAFAAYVMLQIVPLSPAIIKAVSGSTHYLYVRTSALRSPSGAGNPAAWETLSIAPVLTGAALLKLLACFGAMLIVARYPLEPRADGRHEAGFTAALGLAVLSSALLAGIAGAIFLFAGHRDASPAVAMAMRARGTFHNPDHFADYLMLAFPFALAGALSPSSFIRREWREPFAVFAAMAAVVCLVGLMISLSRSAWLAGLLGSAAFLFAASRRRPQVEDGRGGGQVRLMRYGALAGCLLFVLALAVAGTPATKRIGARLDETAHNDTSMLQRVAVWRDSLAMVRDFPLFGVGLGGWPEIFTRYDLAPWDPDLFWGETHNDYLQLLEEAGVIGLVLAGWVLVSQARELIGARRKVSSRRLALVAAAIAAAVGAAVHEFSDFSLQVPANALLLMVILGLAHRQAADSGVQWWEGTPTGKGRLYAAVGATAIAALALFLMRCAWRHDRLPYPDNLNLAMDASLDAGTAQAPVASAI